MSDLDSVLISNQPHAFVITGTCSHYAIQDHKTFLIGILNLTQDSDTRKEEGWRKAVAVLLDENLIVS